ncbi:MAG: ATP-binding protein [Oscillospiraceae bacterium]|nr:ATP-binding protein [Oscillospiraceae bacterium]
MNQLNFEEINGVQNNSGLKIVCYGQEGVGKSSLAAQFPGAIFIDCEGSTTHMNVRRLPRPICWDMLCDEITFILENHQQKGYKSVIIDTFDWAERLAIEQICQEHSTNQKTLKGIEDFGYGKGWQYECELISAFLDRLEQLISAGINVVILAHATTKKVTLPEELDEYDHWEMKLGSKTTNKIAPLLKEWSDMTLFLAFQTNITAIDTDGKKHKATSQKRVMYTTKTAWWDAKNRFGLPEKLPLTFDSIASVFNRNQAIICEKCKQEIQSVDNHSPEWIAMMTQKKYQRKLCWDCAVKAKSRAKEMNQNAGTA